MALALLNAGCALETFRDEWRVEPWKLETTALARSKDGAGAWSSSEAMPSGGMASGAVWAHRCPFGKIDGFSW